MITYNTKIKVLIVAVFALALFGRYGWYYLDKKYDTYRRPWAYSSNPDSPLLVGRWSGVCTDPDKVVHKVNLEIFEPQSDEERMKKFNRRPRKKRSRSSATFFDGIATVEANGKSHTCELWGGLDKADGHRIHFQLRPLDDVHPPGFNLNLLEGNWQQHTIDLSVVFAWFRPDGSSFSDSADPRYDTKGRLLLTRQ